MSVPMDDVLESSLRRASEGGVAFEDFVASPMAVEPKPRTLLIIDRRTRESGRPWHVVGAAILVLWVGFVTVYAGRGWFRDLGAMTLLFAVAALGAGLWWRGRPSQIPHEVPLLWMDSALGALRVREHARQDGLMSSSNIAFDEVKEVLFAQRRFHPPGARQQARVDGAAVFIRLWDGAVWPIIPATSAKRDAYNIALGVAQRLNVGVKQVGAGWSDSPPD